MPIEQFMRLVQLLGNSLWVRHYLAAYPDQMVVEIANIGGEQLDQVRTDLSQYGFQELPATSMAGIALHRFAVNRTSDSGSPKKTVEAVDEAAEMRARMEPVEDYRATVAMLLQHAKRAKHVSHEEVLEIAAMSADELRRRAVVARDWHRLFSMCLDGLPLLQALGAPPDGCWFPRDIRRVVEMLIAQGAENRTRLEKT
mgnify:FL=1